MVAGERLEYGPAPVRSDGHTDRARPYLHIRAALMMPPQDGVGGLALQNDLAWTGRASGAIQNLRWCCAPVQFALSGAGGKRWMCALALHLRPAQGRRCARVDTHLGARHRRCGRSMQRCADASAVNVNVTCFMPALKLRSCPTASPNARSSTANRSQCHSATRQPVSADCCLGRRVN